MHSLIADHVLEMSIKLKLKHCFALVVFSRFPTCCCQGLLTLCDLCHKIRLYYYAETKEIIDEQKTCSEFDVLMLSVKELPFSRDSYQRFY